MSCSSSPRFTKYVSFFSLIRLPENLLLFYTQRFKSIIVITEEEYLAADYYYYGKLC
jgi:hypothetical protein